jgi:DNA-binding NarL/FixJ family response regulator
MFHDGLVRVLEAHASDVEIVGSAASWEEARDMLEEAQPEAILADHRFADEMMSELEHLPPDAPAPGKILFIIPDENKVIVYQRRQIADITIDRLIEVL